MRITIVSGFFLPLPPLAGGAMEKIWWRLAQEFTARGHDVTIVTRRWPGRSDHETVEGIRIVRLPGFAHRRRLAANLLLDAWWGLRVGRALPESDILVTNTVALPVWVAARRPQAGRLVVNLNRYPKGQLRWYRGVARVQAASAAIAEAAARQAPMLGPVIRVAPNPIDWRLFAEAGQGATRGSPVRLGFHGRIHPEKGLSLLIAAANRLLTEEGLPDWQLTLRGPMEVSRGGGGERFVTQLQHEAAPLTAAGRFQLLPPEYEPARLARACAALDVFCYPTLAETGEALPVAVLEAMAAARPVVVTGLECFRHYVTAGSTGEVLDGWRQPHAPERLAALLAGLLKDPERRRQLGEAGQQRVRELDFPRIAEAMLADFAQLHHGNP